MNQHIPDKWVVVKIKGKDYPLTYKVFGCWFGGYLDSNSWKLNSGIKSVTESKHYYLFQGFSGSVYKCNKDTYGTHMYGHGVLQDIIEVSKEHGGMVEIMPEDTKWEKLKYD